MTSSITVRSLKACGLLWAGLMQASGCAEPDYGIDSCDLTCESECPSGFECRAGYCVAPGYERACTEPLRLRAPTAVDHFVCEPFEVSVSTDGGRAPYHYTVSTEAGKPLPKFFDVDDSDGLVVSAPADSLDPNAELTFVVQVSDEHGNSVEDKVVVYPRRCTQALQPDVSGLCVGTEVNVPLDAEGGFENYTWSVTGELPAGLQLEDGFLVGVLTEESIGNYDVELEVEDRDEQGSDDHEPKVLSSSVQVAIDVRDCLRIVPPTADVVLCAGDKANIELTAKGGTPPYAWSADALPDELRLNKETGIISGTTDARGVHAIEISVRDAEGEKVTETLSPLAVNACPIIRTDRIVACVGEPVSDSLLADPVDDGLRWRKLSGPDDLTVESDGRLRWIPKEPLEAKLGVSVESAEGERVGEIPVAALAANSLECNPLELETTLLPDACAGQHYSFGLLAHGGVGGYLWGTQGEWPEWLTLDPDSGELSGTAPLDAAGTYALPVLLTSGLVVAPELALRVRESCKYAFIGREDGSARLFVADVRQGSTPDTEPQDVSVNPDVDVVDFAFSANGEQLGFVSRAADSDAPDSFAVLSITDRDERPLAAQYPADVANEFELDRIDGFAWDHSGARVALTFTTTESKQFLVVLDATAELAPSQPVAIENSGLGPVFWLGDTACYLGKVSRSVDDEELHYIGVTCHSLDENFELGLGQMTFPIDEGFYGPAELLQFNSRPHSFAMFLRTAALEPYDPYAFFDADPFPVGLGWGVPDPTLSWVTRPGDEVYSELATDLVRFPIAPEVDSQGEALGPEWILPECEQLIAWSGDGRGLACSSSGTLQLARFDTEGALLDAQVVADAHDLEAQDYSRAFSVDGRWFVYDTPEHEVFAVDLEADTWRSEPVLSTDLGGFSALQPVASGVVYHGADGLFLLPAPEPAIALSGGIELDAALPCGHDAVINGPDAWCGNAVRPARSVVVGGGSGLVFRDVGGKPYVVDLLAHDLASLEEPARRVNASSLICPDTGCASRVKSAHP